MAPTRTGSDNPRWLGFGLYIAALMVLHFQPLRELARLSRQSELHSHVPLIPLVSLYFLLVERGRIFAGARSGLAAGLPVALAGIALFITSGLAGGFHGGTDRLPAMMLGFWLSVVGGFMAFFGPQASRAAAFPLAFLAFVIPLPEALVDRIVPFLQNGSATMTDFIFKSLGVTFLREGLSFHLARVSVQVAPECSSIRSSLALLITGTVAAKLLLGRWWSRSLLVLVTIPLALVKNAIRIATITLLAQHVDMRFLTGHWLHRSGGFVFFGITLGIFGGFLLALRWLENVGQARSSAAKAAVGKSAD